MERESPTMSSMVRNVAAIVFCMVGLTCCGEHNEPTREEPHSSAPAFAEHHEGRSVPPPDPEEQRRRAEAVRRAAEELSVRGIDTSGYLMNLIVEGDDYRVAFVKQAGRSLRSEITVKVRRDNFDIVSVDGPEPTGER